MNITILIDINDKITEDITSAFRVEKYSDTKVELYRRLSNDSKKHRIRFRNTYQVPSGMQVVVDTPPGEKSILEGNMFHQNNYQKLVLYKTLIHLKKVLLLKHLGDLLGQKLPSSSNKLIYL
jgi:hypothetical protein